MEQNQYIAKFYERVVKRFFDIALSTAGLIVLSPFVLICILAIKIDDIGGSILFKQERNGKNGKVFKITKFRTMKRELCGADLEPTADTLTGIGKFMRKLSLDEIPQLFSVISGKMSLIGPRPLPLQYYDWFSETERRRFNVCPGLTGLSQINGRANLNWDERFSLDVQYVDNLSFGLDLKIFFRTFAVISSHKNVIPDADNILENFDEYRRKQLQQIQSKIAKQPKKDSTRIKKPKSADTVDRSLLI